MDDENKKEIICFLFIISIIACVLGFLYFRTIHENHKAYTNGLNFKISAYEDVITFKQKELNIYKNIVKLQQETVC